jgi:hypothetical protein
VNCGQAVEVKDFYGAYAVRFVAQCEGRFLTIAYGVPHINGYMLAGWQRVLRELVALAVPPKLTEKTMLAESMASGRYVSFPIVYPLSAAQFSDLLGVPADEVKAELEDLAVRWHEV